MTCHIHLKLWSRPLPRNRTGLTDMLSRPLHFNSLRACDPVRREQRLVAVVAFAARDSDLGLWGAGFGSRWLMAVLCRARTCHCNARDLPPRLHLDIIFNVETSPIIRRAPCRAFEPAPVPVAFASTAPADGHQTRTAASSILSFIPHVRAVFVPGNPHG